MKKPETQLREYCRDLDEWPERWMISEQDLEIGKALVAEFKPFLLDRIAKGRARSTIKKYAEYLWALGGELVGRINQYEAERKLSARALILKYVDESGGPLWRHARDELDHDRYDSVCRGLFKNVAQRAVVTAQRS